MRVLTVTLCFCLFGGLASADEGFNSGLIEFDLEGGSIKETMIWISGWSYASTGLLESYGKLCGKGHIGSKELIVELNRVYGSQLITSEQAQESLTDYLTSGRHCEGM